MIKICKNCSNNFTSFGRGEICRKMKCYTKKGWYQEVHRRIKIRFGKASKCEGTNCKRISTKYVYAKIKGKLYIEKRENFIMLCTSCHTNYDMNNEWRKRLKYARKKGQN